MADDLKDKIQDLLGQFTGLKTLFDGLGKGGETKEEPKKEDVGFKPNTATTDETKKSKLEELEERIQKVEDTIAGFLKFLKR